MARLAQRVWTFPDEHPLCCKRYVRRKARPGAAPGRAEDSMANFVLTHLPEQSFAILKELEALTSLEQLAATLGGCEQVVSQLGPASQDHLKQIKQILREHL